MLILGGFSVLLVLPLRWQAPPVSSFMLQTRAAAQGPAYDYQWVAFANISRHMALAVIAAEDQRFLRHNGFDFTEIKRAFSDYRAGKSLRGASTISQQVAKNMYLWPQRSLLRKALEAWLTLLIECFWPKQRILEIYLNVAQFGDRVFGVGAASQRYFAKPAKQLNAQEAALLAAALPSPALHQITQPSQRLRARQRWILRQMRQLGGLDFIRHL